LKETALEFGIWFKMNKLQFVWAQGSNFDTVLWEHSLGLVNMEIPWRFYNTRDTRTAYHMAGFNAKSIKRQGTFHNALDDAKHQCRCVWKCYQITDGKNK
jgi:hypothetical protein